MVVHYLSKRQDYDDHLDAVSSSTGFTGEEIETALRFDRARGLWTALGDATEVRRTDERKAILVTLCRQQFDRYEASQRAQATGKDGEGW